MPSVTEPTPRPAGKPPAAGPRTLFSVPFRSRMNGAEIAHLRAEAGMTTHFHPKHPAVAPPLGFAPLDSDSGLYLTRVGEPDRWALEGRTWGEPDREIAERWRRHALYVAHGLDPKVAPFPSR